MICVIKNNKVFAIHSDNQVAEIRNKYDGLDIIHIADDTNVTLGGTDPRDSGVTWKDARLLLNSLELDSPFRIKSAFYDESENVIQVSIASGIGETFNGTTINTITKTSDSFHYLYPALASTTYTIYLKNDGIFANSTDGSQAEGSLLIGTVSTNADKSVNTIVDKRPLVSGVGSELIRHQADYTLQVPYAVATGTVNTYSAILNPAPSNLVNGLAVAVKIPVDSTGASTINVNGLGAKTIKKANGTNVTNLKKDGIYTLRYDGVNFILQGEGASGNATASDLLSGKTATTDAGEIVGTIPSKTAQTYTPGTTNQVISAGQYLSGAQTIKGDANLAPNNIMSGKSIFGVAGTAVGGDLVAGETLWTTCKGGSTDSKTPVKIGEFRILNKGGSVRVKFIFQDNVLNTAYLQIYVNNSPRGTLRTGQAWTAFSEDIFVNAGDYVQLYGYVTTAIRVEYDNFSLYLASLPATYS